MQLLRWRNWSRTGSLLLIIVVTVVASSPTASALTAAQKQALGRGVLYFNTEADSCAVSASPASSGGTNGSTSGSWSSGLQPPYILEQFAIEVLKDIAQKRGVSTTDAVTQEHVIALVAFMFGEGGDINNQDLFNPLNAGINAPDLIDGTHAGNGVQSFKSFDAGVEATARTMVGSTQTRLADVLTQQDSSAQQFMYALTYYNKYPGNAFWAEASVNNPGDYYQKRLGLVQQVKGRYADIAGLVLGTPQKEQLLNITAKNKLTYHPVSDNSSLSDAATAGAGDPGCSALGTSGVVAGDIAQTAIKLSWPTSHGLTPKPEYVDALKQYNPDGMKSANGADCGAFVSTVMHATGVDPSYPSLGTGSQLAYARQHTEKYSILDRVTSTADMQSGDILVSVHHTFIFVGSQSGKTNEASASQGTRMPSLGGATITDELGTPYTRIRVIK